MKDGGASVWSRNIEFGFRHGKFGACTIPKCRCNTGRGDTGPELRFVRYLHSICTEAVMEALGIN